MNRDGLPDTSFSQNVGMTGIMSRHVVTTGAIILALPKIGAASASVPLPVLARGAIVMFGMVAAAGLNMLTTVTRNRRNTVIITVSGLLSNAVIAIVVNQVLPADI